MEDTMFAYTMNGDESAILEAVNQLVRRTDDTFVAVCLDERSLPIAYVRNQYLAELLMDALRMDEEGATAFMEEIYGA